MKKTGRRFTSKYSKEALLKKRQELIEKNIELRASLTPADIWFDDHLPKTSDAIKLTLLRPYDLRASLEEKIMECSNRSNWTAFVNNAGTLAHVVHRDGEFHIRMPLYKNVKNCSPKYVQKLLIKRLEGKVQLT